LLHREVPGLGTLEDAIDVAGCPNLNLPMVRPMLEKSSILVEAARLSDRREPMFEGEFRNVRDPLIEWPTLVLRSAGPCALWTLEERPLEVVLTLHFQPVNLHHLQRSSRRV